MLAIVVAPRLQLELLRAVQLLVYVMLIDVVQRAGIEEVAIHVQMCCILLVALHLLLHLLQLLLLLVGHDVVVVVLLTAQAELILHIVEVDVMVMMVEMVLLVPAPTQLLPDQTVGCLAGGVAALLLPSGTWQRIDGTTTFGRLCQETLQYLEKKERIRLEEASSPAV